MGQSNKEKIKDADRQGASEKEQEKRNRFLKKLIVVLAVAIVVTFTVFYVIYYRFSYQADKLTKEMASALVERIYVDADKNIDIRLRYRDEYMALLKFIEGRTVV